MPPLLELAFQVEQYNALPLSGGLWEQPAGLMRKILQVLNVYHAIRRHEIEGKQPGEMAKWRKENEYVWNIVSEMNELRNNYG